MRRLTISVLLVFVVAATTSFAQAPSKPEEPFDPGTTKAIFEFLSGQAANGLLFPNVFPPQIIEVLLSRQHLSEQQRWSPPLGWGGIWTAADADGSIWLRISSPAALDKTRQQAEVVFRPAVEEPIPQALLAHLLTKADTKIAGADLLDLKLPSETRPIAKCRSSTTLTIRLGTGAMVMNQLDTFCDTPKP
jgi:hypothetical protein